MDQSLDPSTTASPTTGSGARARSDRARRRALARRDRQRYGLLLLSILSAFLVQGIASPGPWEQVFVTLLLAMTLLLALWAAESKPSVMRPALAIAALVLIASIVEAAAGDVEGAAARLANLLLVVLAPPAIVVGVVRSLRARAGVTLEAVFGVLCLYILVGMAFALVYGTMANLNHGKFFAGGQLATGARCLYFSFTTLTTVGYGDYTATTNLGHTLSVSEALIGQIYLVTIVSLIVSNLRPRRASADS
ncbi:MAG TPA: potassium channel family protein [Solirubrobacteraceae bacterium]|nr:potassium channel family protein [Solirubrobacteraceae bacterium]